METEPRIRKPRSLTSRADSWGWSDREVDPKHFRTNGAVPDESPSQGSVHRKNRNVCKGSTDRQHHYEVVCDRFYKWSEHMVDQCTGCGKKKGWGFTVYIVKPDWIKKLEARRQKPDWM